LQEANYKDVINVNVSNQYDLCIRLAHSIDH